MSLAAKNGAAGRSASSAEPSSGALAPHLDRIYEYRFRDVPQKQRQACWDEISRFIFNKMDRPQIILDPAAGRGEFLRAVPARECWGVDLVEHFESAFPKIKFILGDATSVTLPDNYFDGVFISNFLEHLNHRNNLESFLAKIYQCLKPGGVIMIMGPNFKYAFREYFDCADHILPLSHVGITEHLFGAGFQIEMAAPRFLPYSFVGRLPLNPFLVKVYLRFPLFWRFFGKQFLVKGRK